MAASWAIRRESAGVAAAPFVASAFLGAALIFLVQPMFARMATPLLGGSPSVWNVSLVCFQAALLAGYGYAHALTRLRSTRLQVGLHALVLALGLLCLPLQISSLAGEPDAARPALWLMGAFALSIAPPFIALSATAPLIQSWYARSGRQDAADPYHLYGASNLGSLLGLATYPLVLEPLTALNDQAQLWTGGYFLLSALLLGAGWLTAGRMLGAAAAPALLAAQAAASAPATPWTLKLRWLALAFIPSSLLVGATTHITTDVASAPFLWAPPLIIYLLTFVLAFAKRPLVSAGSARLLAALAAGLVALAAPSMLAVSMGADLLALFAIALACHASLNALRPDASRLTQFYLIMSLGGVLGGAFNALLAPVLFNGVVEYPLMLVLGLGVLSLDQSGVPTLGQRALRLAAAALVAAMALKAFGADLDLVYRLALLAPAVVALILCRRAPLGAALSLALLFPTQHFLSGRTATYAERSFFGVIRIIEFDNADGKGEHLRVLMHGTTFHGAQRAGGDRLQPLAYYAPGTPIAQTFAAFPDARRVGVVGLGLGSVACYARPGQAWTFYEIDPQVAKVATDASRFTYMTACGGDAPIVIGDARVKLAASDATYDLILLDAFSSDSIPTHLLTLEAMQLYLQRLSADGVLAVHISNRHLRLDDVVARIAQAAGAAGLLQVYAPSDEEAARHAFPSDVVVVSRSQASLDRLRASGRWSELAADDGRPWTDGYSNVVGAMLAKAKARTGG